jgi:hypothetical protein
MDAMDLSIHAQQQAPCSRLSRLPLLRSGEGPSSHFQQNPFGFNVNPTDLTGMTEKSSGRRTGVAPKPRHSTVSSFGSYVLLLGSRGFKWAE